MAFRKKTDVKADVIFQQSALFLSIISIRLE